MQELATGEWIVDSGTIQDYLEEKFPDPPLGTAEDSPQMCVLLLPGKPAALLPNSVAGIACAAVFAGGRPLSAYAAPLLSWTPLSPSPQSSYSPAACSGLDVLGKFGAFIKSSPEEAAEKEADLVECLRGLDAHLTAHGPFIGGAAPCATDCAVMPRLYHMQVGTKYFRVGGFVGLGG